MLAKVKFSVPGQPDRYKNIETEIVDKVLGLPKVPGATTTIVEYIEDYPNDFKAPEVPPDGELETLRAECKAKGIQFKQTHGVTGLKKLLENA